MHLAWKTSDAGANWQHINKGMIDDSDVFSVIVDHDNPQVVLPAHARASIRANPPHPVLEDSGIPSPLAARAC